MKTVSILLVDDDSAFRHVMSGELRRLGFDVATACSGEEAVPVKTVRAVDELR